eukprot:m.9750 g.9750  ORF g.9750 m.9750 type:complete len:448 (-) comp3544_c0_seq1:382-1725(-)
MQTRKSPFKKVFDPGVFSQNNLRVKPKKQSILSPEDKEGVLFLNDTSNRGTPIKVSQIEFVRELGSGNFGTVSLVKYQRYNFARKVINISVEHLNSIRRELGILRKINACPQAVHYFGVCKSSGQVHVFLEYMNVGTLKDVIQKSRSHPSDSALKYVAHSALLALNFLHNELNVIHRDVKPSNILINTKWEVKLCDFGVSKKWSLSQPDTNIGSFLYMSPERIDGKRRYDFSSDCWSLGCSLSEAWCGEYPYRHQDQPLFQQVEIVECDPPLPHAPAITETLLDFLRDCLQKDNANRPSSGSLMKKFGDELAKGDKNALALWVCDGGLNLPRCQENRIDLTDVNGSSNRTDRQDDSKVATPLPSSLPSSSSSTTTTTSTTTSTMSQTTNQHNSTTTTTTTMTATTITVTAVTTERSEDNKTPALQSDQIHITTEESKELADSEVDEG